jgi:hypothetical protein
MALDLGARRRFVWLLAAVFVLIGVYLAASHRFENWAGEALRQAAPTARRVIPTRAKKILREGAEHLPVYGETSTWVARKSGSVVYFGIVALLALVIRKRRPTSLRETLLVTVAAGVGMSTIVEIFEWPEAFGSELFDLGCGAAGGLIAGLLAWWWMKRHA